MSCQFCFEKGGIEPRTHDGWLSWYICLWQHYYFLNIEKCQPVFHSISSDYIENGESYWRHGNKFITRGPACSTPAEVARRGRYMSEGGEDERFQYVFTLGWWMMRPANWYVFALCSVHGVERQSRETSLLGYRTNLIWVQTCCLRVRRLLIVSPRWL